MHKRQQTSQFAGLLAFMLLVLTACQTPPQTKQLLAAPPDIARQHFIARVPFYPQQEFFCGPTTLAEVAGFHGLAKSPDDIAPATFTPGLDGTLQIEMAAATRQLGLVAYTQHRASINQLLSLVADDIPVIVLQNNSIGWLPQWHYAVVVGYDINRKEVILHTGVTEAHRLNFSTFERTWQRANYWLLAMLPSDTSSAQLDPFIYTKACQDLINTQQPAAGIAALITATKQWPDYWLPYFLLGNQHFSTEPLVAASWFAKGLPYAQQQVPYLHNYAMLLSGLGCHNKAIELITTARQLAPEDSKLLNSKQQIDAARQVAEEGTPCQLRHAVELTSV
ncbi:peptidase C39 [Arsukibacterium ikkense]|uniref:Peptidase C39 n=1 Tax=Arsukibacterium ikkense TaxID=336831 RepID=A0A0M2V3X4_9GAMM|nr:PA2778 family cysteine peptidase [Arsukibacterium ikkense]KKO43863.1 peptidase C39 [Arsukibacterium ikkense]